MVADLKIFKSFYSTTSVLRLFKEPRDYPVLQTGQNADKDAHCSIISNSEKTEITINSKIWIIVKL